MDEQTMQSHAEGHAEAVLNGDMDALAADFSEELRPQLPEIAKILPQNITAAEVIGVEVEGEEGVATIRYSGDTDVTIRSQWQEEGGRPVIIGAAPTD